MRPGTLSLPTKRHRGPTFFHLLIVNTNSNSYAMRSKDLEPCDCYNNIKLIIAILLRQQSGHVVGYPWLQGFDDGLAGDAGKCTWQCVTCLDMGVQLHLNEGGIVYCAHILSNTPSLLLHPPLLQLSAHSTCELHWEGRGASYQDKQHQSSS